MVVHDCLDRTTGGRLRRIQVRDTASERHRRNDLDRAMGDLSCVSAGDSAFIYTVEEFPVFDGGGKLATNESIDNACIYFYNRLRS